MDLRQMADQARGRAQDVALHAGEQARTFSRAQMTTAAAAVAVALVIGGITGMVGGRSGTVSRTTHDSAVAKVSALESTLADLSLQVEQLTVERDDLEASVSKTAEDTTLLDARARVLDDRQAELDALEYDLTSRESVLDARESDLDAREESYAAGGVAVPSLILRDGTYLVGVDIAAGEYQAEGLSGCEWSILDRPAGTTSRAGNLTQQGDVKVSLSASDYAFTTDNCGSWTPAG